MTTTLTAQAATPEQAAPETSTFFHVSLLVADLENAVAFYRVLFDVEPSRLFPNDYAEFEVTDPPLLLGLTQCPTRKPGGALNHVGLRFSSEAAVNAVAARLEAAKLETSHEEGVACCYARQTKCWVTDPDHNLWEIYVLFDDLNYNGFGGKSAPELEAEAVAMKVWEHMLDAPVPDAGAWPDGSADEVRLTGTFNGGLGAEALDRILVEARRVLRSGGKVMTEGLVSASQFVGTPNLPGLAARVRSIPRECEPLDALRKAGFVDLYFEQNGDIKCFNVAGVEFRKTRIVGRQPAQQASALAHQVLYKGPMIQVTGDDGTVYRRGEAVALSELTWQGLRHGPAASQFVFLAR
jgi:catechol 2,3-dioxygenase-like lactoylglutathione lyase family enzyme